MPPAAFATEPRRLRCRTVALVLVRALALLRLASFGLASAFVLAGTGAAAGPEVFGPEAALAFANGYRGRIALANPQFCYPGATGIPIGDCPNIIPMTAELWTPAEIAVDFRRRMAGLPAALRKRGIIVVLKTERCATKWLRACSVTTAALEKRSTPLVDRFLVYGVLLEPRDHDNPPGSLRIETGPDAWKNDAAGAYQFQQGPGATLAFLDPADGSRIERTDAVALNLFEQPFQANRGHTPELAAKLAEILLRLEVRAGRTG